MLNYITTPSGNLIARNLIQRVSHIPKTGVRVLDGYGRLLEYVPESNDTLAIQVRDLFREVVLAGRNAKQPDWSFLTPPARAFAVVKATKASKLPKDASDDINTDTEV